MTKGRDDLELVRRVLQKDPEALQAFVRRCSCIIRFLHTINRRKHGPLDRHSIEDLAQKVFLEIWSRIGTYRGDASLETWIWRFCYLQFLAWIQDPRSARSSPDAEEALEEVASADQDPSEEISARLDRVAMTRALLEMPPDKRELIQKKHFDAKTFETIANEEGIPVSTLKDRYYQALFVLQEKAAVWRESLEKIVPEAKKSVDSGPAKGRPNLPTTPEEGMGGRL